MIVLPTLPDSPGCYLFSNERGKIIYIGKAKNLKKRVKSYFSKSHHDPKTELLVENIASVKFIVTDSEVEALILENNLIKKHRPKYNIDLKDAKGYAYLQVTDEEFPRIVIARKKERKGKFIGPFTSAKVRDDARRAVERIFKLRKCNRLPKRACLRHQIGLCDAPCIGEISKTRYNKNVSLATAVLSGKTKTVIEKLKFEMKKHSEAKRYEQAITLKHQIDALGHLDERQVMERERKYDEDVINFVERRGKVYLMLFHIHRGTLIGRNEFVFEKTPDYLAEFLLQYYSQNTIPKFVILPQCVDESLFEFLSSKSGHVVKQVIPKRGERKTLLDLTLRNCELTFFGEEEKLKGLQKILRLNELPEIIECFDISHLSGTAMTGSMVQFRVGKPYKSEYRRFKIKTLDGSNDPKAIEEVVGRRYSRLVREEQELPHLIVVDGGITQLRAALRALDSIGLKLPVIGLAKKNEEIYLPGVSRPLTLPQKSASLQLLRAIRDEAHRFAISYNRLLRKKELLS